LEVRIEDGEIDERCEHFAVLGPPQGGGAGARRVVAQEEIEHLAGFDRAKLEKIGGEQIGGIFRVYHEIFVSHQEGVHTDQ